MSRKPLVTAAVLAVTVSACGADQGRLATETHATQPPQRTTHLWEVRRVRAERAASEAKAKADAELAASPLVSIFGSQAQREAAEAQAYLQQVLAEKPVRKQRRLSRIAASAQVPQVPPRPPRRRDAGLREQPAKPAQTTGAISPPPAIEVTVYDVASGIKTTHFADGRVEEDAFDVATLPQIKSAAEAQRTRIRVVNEDTRL